MPIGPPSKLDLETERHRYEAEFKRLAKEFADVTFVGNTLITQKEQLPGLRDILKDADGILAIHLSMGVKDLLVELLKVGKPVLIFAAPYSGHEWTQFGSLRREPAGAKLECMLTSDLSQLADAVRPVRAIHHLREAIRSCVADIRS